MISLFLYVVSASTNPDKVDCFVPYRINEKWIFFGPCKKRLRERFWKQFLNQADHLVLDQDVFLVGVNGGNS